MAGFHWLTETPSERLKTLRIGEEVRNEIVELIQILVNRNLAQTENLQSQTGVRDRNSAGCDRLEDTTVDSSPANGCPIEIV
jgi:hypothetical protein